MSAALAALVAHLLEGSDGLDLVQLVPAEQGVGPECVRVDYAGETWYLEVTQ